VDARKLGRALKNRVVDFSAIGYVGEGFTLDQGLARR
jgi:hypothetical protein